MSEKHIIAIEKGRVSPKLKDLEAWLHALGSSLAEFFESKIPERYEKPEDQQAHEELQEILEKPDLAEAIRTVIRSVAQFQQRLDK